VYALGDQVVNDEIDDWPPTYLDERFGKVVGQRP